MPELKQLTDDNYKEFIAEGRVVIRTWDEGCGYCVKYEPIFNEYVAETQVKAGVMRLYVLKEKRSSEFKRAYMKQDKQDSIKETVPGTFVFENGELVARHFGAMTKDQLAKLVSDFKAPDAPKENPQQKLYHLFAQKGELVHNMELMSNKLQQVNAEIQQLTQPQKASMPNG